MRQNTAHGDFELNDVAGKNYRAVVRSNTKSGSGSVYRTELSGSEEEILAGRSSKQGGIIRTTEVVVS